MKINLLKYSVLSGIFFVITEFGRQQLEQKIKAENALIIAVLLAEILIYLLGSALKIKNPVLFSIFLVVVWLTIFNFVKV